MFGGVHNVPITIRLILGRGWGQGPTHSQSLQSWFAHIPGLKVVMPSSPSNAKGLLLSSIFDPNPVIYIEHRWLHNQIGNVEKGYYENKIGLPEIRREGKDITIVSMSYMSLEAERAATFLQKQNISCEIIDLASINPLKWEVIYNSVSKTGRLIALDTGNETCSFSAEVISRVTMNVFNNIKSSPIRIACPDVPCPTSYSLTKDYYPDAKNVVSKILEIFEVSCDTSELDHNSNHHDSR